MKRFSLFLAFVCLLAFAFGANAADLEIGTVDGTWPSDPSKLDCAGGQVVINLSLNNNTGSAITGSTNGFILYSSDGASWTYAPPETTIIIDPNPFIPPDTIIEWFTRWDTIAYPIGILNDGGAFGVPIDPGNMSTDGMGVDTCGFGGFRTSGPGLPPGPYPDIWSITFGIDCADSNKTICLDSSWFPPGGSWLWSTVGGPVNPTWGGMQCWTIGKVPCLNPVISNDPVSLTGDHCNTMSFDFDFTDADGGGPYTFSSTGAGSINSATGQWSFVPSLASVGAGLSVDVSVADATCGSSATVTVNLNFTNVSPGITCPGGSIPVGQGNPISFDVAGTSGDCDAITYSIGAVNPSPVNAPTLVGTTVTFNTDLSEGGTTFNIEVIVTDGLDSASCTQDIDVLSIEPLEVQIEKTHKSFQGMHELVDVTVNKGSLLMGGFDLLLGYDASALNFQSAIEGSIYASCGWEYFTYRYSWNGNCGNQCPSGKVRVVGIAETNNGANHPSCYTAAMPFTLFTLDFLVSDDRTLECQYAPIRFCWFDCGDNTISSKMGDSLFINRDVIDFGFGFPNIADHSHNTYPSYFGAGANCIVIDTAQDGTIKPSAYRLIDFVNGGVDIACADSIDARGDINLNGLVNEIADAVLFSNYFVYGIGVFTVNIQGQIAASDVNADGLTLSVSDLVYLIRIVIGDANPFPKVTEVAASYVYDARGNLSVDAPMGAAAVVVSGDVSPILEANNMEMLYNYDAEANVTRVLVYSMEEGQTFSGTFLSDLSGGLVSIEMATYEGAPVAANAVPADYALNQNYPNPFNPSTSISFSLPTAGEYTLSIYNVTGQEVASFTGTSEAGLVELEWNATDMASGIYFYKLVADNFTDTRKMVLLK